MTALGSSLGIVAYMAAFATVGFVFLFANLLVGRLLRPSNPHAEKLEIYECGEPTIGSSFVQFDLRFYVVALLFIIFDVEVATRSSETNQLELTPSAKSLYQEMGVRHPTVPATTPPSLVGLVEENASEDVKASQRIHEG